MVDSVSSSKLTTFKDTVSRSVSTIYSNRSLVKKMTKLSTTLIKSHDIFRGIEPQQRVITDVLKCSGEVIDFTGTIDSVFHWVFPFQKKNLDTKALKESLESSLSKEQTQLADEIFTLIAEQKELKSKDDVKGLIRAKLEEKEYPPEDVNRIVNLVTIEQKARPLSYALTTVCFSLLNFSYSVLPFKEWGVTHLTSVVGLSKIAFVESPGTVENISVLVNPFNRDTLDEKKLKKSLEFTLNHTTAFAEEIYQEVLAKEEFKSKREVKELIRKKLENKEYSTQEVERILNEVKIQQKPQPITELFTSACFTLLNLYGNIQALKKWEIVDLTKMINFSKIAADIGTKTPALAFVMKITVETVLGTIACAALIVCVGEAAYRMIINDMKIYYPPILFTHEEREKALKERRKAEFDVFKNLVDLGTTAIPLVFTVSPPMLLGFALFSNMTAIIIVLVK